MIPFGEIELTSQTSTPVDHFGKKHLIQRYTGLNHIMVFDLPTCFHHVVVSSLLPCYKKIHCSKCESIAQRGQ